MSKIFNYVEFLKTLRTKEIKEYILVKGSGVYVGILKDASVEINVNEEGLEYKGLNLHTMNAGNFPHILQFLCLVNSYFINFCHRKKSSLLSNLFLLLIHFFLKCF